MAWLTRPTPHRLVIMMSLILTLTVAMPELASGKHRRPKYRISTAGLVAGFGDPSGLGDPAPFFTSPERFDCTWDEAAHDYRCTPSPTNPLNAGEEWPDPFPLKQALWRAGDTPLGEGWAGLANPEFAPTFSCVWDGAPALPDEQLAEHYTCTFADPQVHTFTVAEIVSVCDVEVAVCEVDPETDLPAYTHQGRFETDGWYLPDTMPPDTAVTQSPSGIVASRDATLRFSSSENGSSFACRLDGGAWEQCEVPQAYEKLKDGPHSFAVRATDAAANLDQTPAGSSWTIDATPPDTSIVGGPRKIARDRTPTFRFSASEPTATFECRLDGGSFTPCSSPHTVKPRLADGRHSFSVRASDVLGNRDLSHARRSFTVDTTGPLMWISGRSVQLTPRGVANVRVRCPSAELSGACAGKLTLRTAKQRNAGPPANVRLGREGFRVRRGRARVVRVKLSPQGRRLVAQFQSVAVRATVRARDRLGNAATTRRGFVLEAPAV